MNRKTQDLSDIQALLNTPTWENNGTVDTRVFTDELGRTRDDLIVAIYNAVHGVSLDEAKEIACAAVTMYELIHKNDGVKVDPADIDLHAFEAALAAVVTIRDYNQHI